MCFTDVLIKSKWSRPIYHHWGTGIETLSDSPLFYQCICLFFQWMNCVCIHAHTYTYVSMLMCVWVHYERGQRSMSEVSQVCFLYHVLGLSLNLGLPVWVSLTSPACYEDTLPLPPKFFLTRGCCMSFAFTRMLKIWTLALILEY